MPQKRAVVDIRAPETKRAKENSPSHSNLDAPPPPSTPKNTVDEKICFSSYIQVASHVLNGIKKRITNVPVSEKRNGKTIFPIDVIHSMANYSSKHPRMERSLNWLCVKYKEMEINAPNEEHKAKEREAHESDYDPETRALITIFKLDRQSLRILKCTSLTEVAKASPDTDIEVNVYVDEPEANWKMFYENHTMTLKEYAKDPIGFGRDFDLMKCDNWNEMDQALKQTFRRLAPLSHADLCRGAAEGEGITTPFAYFKGKKYNYTRPHCESAGLLSVNVNVSGEASEWFFCSPTHWQKIMRMAQERGLDPRDAPYWPVEEELRREGIQVYKIDQEAGEAIVVNGGCVHWVKGRNSSHSSWNLLLPGYKALLGFAYCSAINQSIQKNNDINEEALLWSFMIKDNVVPVLKKHKQQCIDLLFILAAASLSNFRAVTKKFEESSSVTVDDLITEDPTRLLKCDQCSQCLYFYSFTQNDSTTDYCYNCAVDKKDVSPHFYRSWQEHVKILENFTLKYYPVEFGSDVKEEPMTEIEEEEKETREAESRYIKTYTTKSFSGDIVHVPVGFEITLHLPNTLFEIRKVDERVGEDSTRIITRFGKFIRKSSD